MRVISLTCCVLGALACSPRPAEDPAASSPPRSDAKQPEQAPAQAKQAEQVDMQPSDPSYALMQQVCASACTGPFARVTVFRDATGAPGRLRFDGDMSSCSHPPRIYFDLEGRETLTVPEKPVTPGSPEAEAFAASQAAQIEGLSEAETLSCFDAERCEPSRSEGFRSESGCRSDSDCVACECAPVNRVQWRRRGGAEACNIDGEECVATNPACCEGRCVLAR